MGPTFLCSFVYNICYNIYSFFLILSWDPLMKNSIQHKEHHAWCKRYEIFFISYGLTLRLVIAIFLLSPLPMHKGRKILLYSLRWLCMQRCGCPYGKVLRITIYDRLDNPKPNHTHLCVHRDASVLLFSLILSIFFSKIYITM